MKTSCEFHFGFWDVTARGDAHFEASQNQPFANAEDINIEDGITFPDVATLEPSFGWLLDGSKTILPNSPGSYTWGWWSMEQSGADRSFTSPPVLTINFTDDDGVPTPHSSAGITFGFYTTLPKAINIKWYGDSGNLLADEDYSPDGFLYFCERQVEDYYKVVITVLAMSYPHRFLRVTSILFGALEVIKGERVTKAVLTEEISPVALTMPINKLELDFFTANERFALLDPQGAYKMFQQKQELLAYKTVDGVKTLMGDYFLQTATGTVDAVTHLSCICFNGILDAADYDGGIFADVPVGDLLDDILTPEGIGFELNSALAGVTISGYLPICKKRVALQQIAFAIGAIMDPTRAEVMRVYPMPTVVTAPTITPARKILGHKITLEELVTQVDVLAHKYVLGSDIKELSKTNLGVGTHTIKFSAPVSVTAATGATLVKGHPNYCIVQVTAAGEVTLSGYEYADVTTVYTVKINPLPAGVSSSIKSMSSATLVDSTKAAEVAQRLYDYYQNRYTDEGLLLPGDERAAEKATISSLGGKTLTGHFQRVVTDLSGGCIETITLRERGQ